MRAAADRLESARDRVRRSRKFQNWKANVILLKPTMTLPAAMEPHYSPLQVSKMWGVSTETARRIFSEEPGVLKIGHAGSKYRRAYITLRIPESVVERVHRKLSGAEQMSA
jgi:hypothetical protein